MRWDDIVNWEWTIPVAERQKGTGGTLKLPPLALDIIDAQPRILDNPYGGISPQLATCGYNCALWWLSCRVTLPSRVTFCAYRIRWWALTLDG
jgi:hypothetical protein